MTDARPSPSPDPDLIAQVLAALDDGVPAEIAPLLAAVGGSEPAVRQALAAVLRYRDQLQHERHQIRQDGAAVSPPPPTPTPPHPQNPDAIPTTIGPYRILSRLGAGGMGTVYKAERGPPVPQLVAIKVVQLRVRSPEILARFELERRALAAMNHSNIAKVLDVGSTAQGEPYFVMELVEGTALTDYCDRRTLSIEDRIRLLQQTCAGVQHAHQKGIVHRDLKPANILVVQEGGAPVPKIVDFGIAKAIDRELRTPGFHTEQQQILGTPEYMAPEQAALDPVVIDTRADVYSLGVVLYELLTGELPFASQELRAGGWQGMQRMLCEAEPPKPSSRFATEAAATSAARRSSTVRHLARGVRGDLDWIVLRAMAKEPERRYGSPNELSLDLDNFLRHEPVLAGPPSTAYRLKKLIRRYRVQFAAAVLVGLFLVGGTIGTAIGFAKARDSAAQAQARAEELKRTNLALSAAQRAEAGQRVAAEAAAGTAREAEAKAEARARELEQVARFQAAQLSGVDPAKMGTGLRQAVLAAARTAMQEARVAPSTLDANIQRLEELLQGADFTGLALQALQANVFEPALAAVDREFADQPLVQARILRAIGGTLAELGLLAAADGPGQRALELCRQRLGEDHLQTLDCLRDRGALLLKQGRAAAAEPLLDEVRQRLQAHFGADAAETWMATGDLAQALMAQGRLAEAEPLFRAALAGLDRTAGGEDPRTLAAMQNLATLLANQHDWTAAEPLLRQVAQRSETALGPSAPTTLTAKNSLANLLVQLGRHAEAETLLRQTLRGRRESLGMEHPDSLQSLRNLGNALKDAGKIREAVPVLQDALALHRRVFGNDHPETMRAINSLGDLLREAGEPEAAEALLREALARRTRVLGKEHAATLVTMHDLAELLIATRRLDEAETLARELLQLSRKVHGDEDQSTLNAINSLAMVLHAQKQFAEAEVLYGEAMAGLRRLRGAGHADTLAAMANYATVLADEGKLAEAAPISREAVRLTRQTLGDDHPDTLIKLHNFAYLLRKLKQYPEAEELQREAFERGKAVLGPDHPTTLVFAQYLGALLVEAEQPAAALPLLRDTLERRQRTLGEDDRDTQLTTRTLAGLLLQTGDFAAAEPLARSALRFVRKLVGDDHPATLTWLDNLLVTLKQQGKLAEATPLARELYERSQRALGVDHDATLDSMLSLARMLRGQGRLAEAEPLYRDAVPRFAAKYVAGDMRAKVPAAEFGLLLVEVGRARTEAGEFASAEPALLEAHGVLSDSVGAQHEQTVACVELVVRMYESWAQVDASGGHTAQAGEWRARLLKKL